MKNIKVGTIIEMKKEDVRIDREFFLEGTLLKKINEGTNPFQQPYVKVNAAGEQIAATIYFLNEKTVNQHMKDGYIAAK